MKNVTPNRVLPDWAIVELSRIAAGNNWKIVVKPLAGLDHVIIKILGEGEGLDSSGWTGFRVTMQEDWEDLKHLRQGDLRIEVAARVEEY